MNLSDLKIPELENKMGEWITKCDAAADAWAQAKADYENHEECKKTITNGIIKELTGAYNAREAEAYTHPKYIEWLEKITIMRRAYFDALAKYEMAKLKVDCIRSLISTRREELKRFQS